MPTAPAEATAPPEPPSFPPLVFPPPGWGPLPTPRAESPAPGVGAAPPAPLPGATVAAPTPGPAVAAPSPGATVAAPTPGPAVAAPIPGPPPLTALGPAFPPAPLPDAQPPGRHRASSRAANWLLLTTLVVILLAAVAIVLWRNGALPNAAGTSAGDSPATGGAPPVTTDDPAVTDPAVTGSSTVDGANPTTSVPLPPIGGGATPTSGPDGDLGLAVPISQPACDGTWTVILRSATEPATYRSDVEGWLAEFPGSAYLLTQGSCTSLRQQTSTGNAIYAVYSGTYASQQEACTAVAQFGPPAYIKVLDNQTPPDQAWACPVPGTTG